MKIRKLFLIDPRNIIPEIIPEENGKILKNSWNDKYM